MFILLPLKRAISIHIISSDLKCIRCFFAECFRCLCNPRPTDRSKPWLVEASPSPVVPIHPWPVIPISQRDQYLKSQLWRWSMVVFAVELFVYVGSLNVKALEISQCFKWSASDFTNFPSDSLIFHALIWCNLIWFNHFLRQKYVSTFKTKMLLMCY